MLFIIVNKIKNKFWYSRLIFERTMHILELIIINKEISFNLKFNANATKLYSAYYKMDNAKHQVLINSSKITQFEFRARELILGWTT